MIKWAGWIMVLYATAHTLGALTVLGAARHAGSWFSGQLWEEDLTQMSTAGSAYWLSLASFGPPLIVLGLTVLWMERHGVTPPSLIAWILGLWTLVDGAINPLTPWPILLLACILLLAGIRREGRRGNLTAVSVT